MTDEVPIRDAATVVLLRDGAQGIEVWLLTRVRQMAFGAGMSVFPGGRVDADDEHLPLHGADVANIAARFDCAEPFARGLLGAAVREIFEETGVLVTVPPADLSAARADVESGRVAFGDLLRDHGLAVDAGSLRPWSRWVTPAGEVRRYDARFFIAALPEGVDASAVTTEASGAEWVPVGTAIEQAQRGERGFMPPTIATLESLQQYPTVADAMAASAARPLDAVRPELQVGADGSASVRMPDGTTAPVPPGLLR
ncbi:MAG TPA: NUDIX hydrolase [Jatrophihabitans sp.]|nr:NUDIX hydrolase [Jatrophihabitans sp.]